MKILNILNNLSPTQCKSFDLFMSSPFFNIHPDVQDLYQIIRPYWLDGRLDENEVQQVYTRYVTKFGPRSKNAFHKISHQLKVTIEKFLQHDELKKDNQESNILLLIESYSQFEDPAYFQQLIEQEYRRMDQLSERNQTYHYQLFQLQQLQYFHPDTDKRQPDAGVLLQKIQYNLDRFYYLSKLQLAAELITRNNYLAEDHKVPLLDEISVIAKKEKSTIFKFYLLLIKLIKEPEKETTFNNLIQQFENNRSLFSQSDQATICNFLINYSNQKFMSGDQKYLRHLYKLYRFFVRQKFHMGKGERIADNIFLNIIITYCLYKSFDEAYQFLQQNKKYLQSDNQQSVVQLSWAYIHFHENEYEKAWTALNKTSMTNWDFKTRARSLQIRCYYEHFLSYADFRPTLSAELSSFRKFIYRLPKRSNHFKQKYFNKIKVIRALLQFDPLLDQKKVFKKKWLDFIANHPVTADEWLKKKINAL